MNWFIRIRKSNADVTLAAVYAFIFITGLSGIKAFVYDAVAFQLDRIADLDIESRYIIDSAAA